MNESLLFTDVVTVTLYLVIVTPKYPLVIHFLKKIASTPQNYEQMESPIYALNIKHFLNMKRHGSF